MSNLFSNYLENDHFILTVNESKDILSKYGFPVNKSVFISNKDQIQTACENLTFPLVIKIVSPQITHKTDVGGVLLNLTNTQDVISGFISMTTSLKVKFPNYDIQGVLLEEQIPDGIELIAGVVNDPTFGQCLMFGLGGIFVELLKDVSFRLIPATKLEIESMISEIKFAKILNGLRGKKVNKKELIATLLKLSNFIEENSKFISETDLNPIIITDERVVVVDARIILRNNKS